MTRSLPLLIVLACIFAPKVYQFVYPEVSDAEAILRMWPTWPVAILAAGAAVLMRARPT